MTKFEDELFNNVPCKFELTTEAEYKKSTLINHFKNWHSDEELQEHFIANKNLIDVNTKLAEEIANLKSQLQQQALPVVPEDVAKLPPFDDMKEYVLDERLLTIREYLNKLDDKSNNDITEAEAWCMIHEDIVYRAMLDGYTVEKPQMFYLKHIDFCKTDKHYDWFTIKHSDGPLNHLRVEKGQKPTTIDCKFTQQEIDSMNTGSYEQIKVEVEK